jgi:hypothetical protein
LKADLLIRFPGREPEVIGTVDIPLVAVPAERGVKVSPVEIADLGEFGRALARLSPSAQAVTAATADLAQPHD